jgi:putative drug exporter of the RND superfamily
MDSGGPNAHPLGVRRLAPTRIGRWSTRRPWRALAIWLSLVVALGALVALAGIEQLENGASGESGRGYDMLDRNRLWEGPHEIALFRSPTLRASDPEFRAAIGEVAQAWSVLPGELASPLTPEGRRQLVSKDGHAALVVLALHDYVDRATLLGPVTAAARAHPQVSVAKTGEIDASDAVDRQNESDLNRAELLSVPVTLVVLLLAFGALVAAAVPVIVALTAVIAA